MCCKSVRHVTLSRLFDWPSATRWPMTHRTNIQQSERRIHRDGKFSQNLLIVLIYMRVVRIDLKNNSLNQLEIHSFPFL